MPHHSASVEGLIGGGRPPVPGEASLAHCGVLFLDEASEFRKNAIQALREPAEENRVRISRAGTNVWFPSNFQLVLAVNPCPCGNLGHPRRVCLCDARTLHRYWRRIGGALMDRVDIRIPVRIGTGDQMEQRGESSATVAARVSRARKRQRLRFGEGTLNSGVGSSALLESCRLEPRVRSVLNTATERLGLSSRAYASILRVARTIADLAGSDEIEEEFVLEAVQHRRYCETDFYWNRAS
jgi:magnesium chelatase family protein